MRFPDWPEARVGMEITRALWNLARAAVRALRLREGPGIRLRWTPNGTIISAGTARPWTHPFQVSLRGAGASIAPGTVNGKPVLIEGVPLDEEPAPALSWSALDLDENGAGYIALELTCDDAWKMIPETLTAVQVATFDKDEPLADRKARWPLARLRQRADGRVECYQIVMAPLVHEAKPRTAEAEIARHFFY